MKKIFVINSIFLYRKLNPNSGLLHCINTSLITWWNFLSFRVSQFGTSLESPALTFYNLALFSIYSNDGTTISTEVNTCRKLKLRTMILFISNSVLFFRQSLLYPHLKARYFSFSFYFSRTKIKRLRVDIQFTSWNESQTQVIHALNISLHTLKDSTFFGAQL